VTTRSAKSLVVLLVLLAAALLVGGLSWFLSRDSAARPTETVALTPSRQIQETPAPTEQPLDRAATREQATRAQKSKTAAPGSATTPDATPTVDASSGAITIHLKTVGGKPYSGDWTLDIEDNELAAKHEPGARRALDEHGFNVTVEARPGVVHALAARAKGLSSDTQRVQLPPQRSVAEVDLTLVSAAAIQGRVVDANGAGASGLDVWLVPGFVTPSGRTSAPPMTRTIVTDASGAFRVESLLPGRWNVLVGPRDNPTARHNDVTLAATDVTLDPITLPQMYSVVVRVKDDQGRALSGAAVTGRGSVGGAVEGTSDGGGEVAFNALQAGRWRMFATTTDGKRGVAIADVPIKDSSAIEVVVRAMPAVGDRR
jgi:hypothetical protein